MMVFIWRLIGYHRPYFSPPSSPPGSRALSRATSGLHFHMGHNLKIKYTKQARLKATVLSLALALASCTTTTPLTDQDIELAQQQGQLEPMFDQVQSSLENARPGSDQALALTQLRDDIGARLADPRLQRIDELLGKGAYAPLSLSELDELDANIAAVRKWAPYTRPEINNKAVALRRQTDAEIVRLNGELEALDEGESGRRYALLTQLAALGYGTETVVLRDEAAQELEKTYAAGVAAVERKQLPLAQGLLAQVVAADPNYRDLVYYRELVATGMFEQKFWQALVDGLPDEAFRLFYDYSQTRAFETHGNKVAQDAGELGEYFDALGEKWLSQGDPLESYRAFRKSSYIRIRLDRATPPSTGQQHFIQEMARRYEGAARAGSETEALAYLSIIESLDPENLLSANSRGGTYDRVFEQAAAKFNLSIFTGEYGAEVTDALSSYLTQNSTGKVLVFSSGAEPMEGRDNGPGVFFVSGEVLSAEVVSHSSPRTESRDVVVGTAAGPNPAYQQWEVLPRGERNQLPEPPQTTALPRYENVTVSLTDITREASLAVRFESVSRSGEELQFAEQVSDSATQRGTEEEALSAGDFSQDVIEAQMPSGSEMLLGLVDSVSTTIGKMLADQVPAIEVEYEAEAQRLGAINKRRAAAGQWTYAYVVSDPQTPEHTRLRTAMEESVLKI